MPSNPIHIKVIPISETLQVVVEDNTRKGIITTYYQYMWQGRWVGKSTTKKNRMDREFYNVSE